MDLKYIHDYTGMLFQKIMKLPLSSFYGLLRDAFIYRANQHESGRDYLEQCWILEQTEPDREGMRRKSGKEDVS